MATRHERVVIDLDDRFTSPMARATASTAMFRKELDSSGRQVIAFDKTTKDTSPSIDRLSGRLAILGRTAAALGPGLVPITTALTPALAGMATQLGFVAAGAGTAVLAFKGVGDGLKALNEYQLDPTQANLAKLREEMEKIGPAAQSFVGFLDEISPRLRTLRTAAQEGMLPGAQEGIDRLLARLPQVRRVVSEVADTVGDLMAGTGRDLAGSQWDDFFTYLETEARPALTTFGQTVGNLASGMAELWMALDPLSDDFTTGLLNASQAFEDWAASLAETEGFQDFLEYVRETAPQVLDTIGSLADMLIDVGTAAAPLGGPVLAGIEAAADAISAIAESDLGTPIMAAVSAMSALSLATRAWTGIMGSAATMRVRQLTTDLRTMGDVGVVAWGRSADEAKRYADASERVRTTLGRMARTTALIGGVALATSDLGDKMGISNTASMALIGTFLGPWGTAAGAAVGATMDLAAANNDLETAVSDAMAAIESGSIDIMRQKLAVLKAELAQGNWFTDPWDEMTGATAETLKAIDRLEFEISMAKNASGGLATVFGSSLGPMTGYTAQQFEIAALSADDFAASLDKVNAILEKRASFRSYAASLRQFKEGLEENGKARDPRTEAGAENQANLDAIVGTGLKFAETLKGLDRVRFIGNIRREFFKAAESMNMPIKRANALAKDLGLLGKVEAKPKVKVEGKEKAESDINDVDRALDALWGANPEINVRDNASRVINGVRTNLYDLNGDFAEVYIRTVRQNVIENKLAGGPGGNEFHGALGGTVPGERYPYGDKIHAMLAPGEEIISNRYGQADRHRALLQAINANRYANGGTAGGSSVTNYNYGSSGPMQITGRLRLDNGQMAEIVGVVDDRFAANRRHDHATGRR